MSSATSPPPASGLGQQLVLLNGPLFIGSLFNWALFATVTFQVYLYYSAGFKDSRWLKYMVGIIYALDIVQTVFATHAVWHLVIIGWGDVTVFVHPPWTTVTFPIFSGIIAAAVQSFFAWRIWILKQNWVAKATSILIVLIAVMQCLSGIVFGIRSAFIEALQIFTLRSGIVVWLVGAFAADLIIVVAMLIILRSARNPSFDKTANIIDKLMVQTVHSGAITAVAATVELVLFLVAPDNFMHNTPVLFLGKLYSNVLLANLNGRQRSDRTYNAYGNGSQQSSNGMSLGHVSHVASHHAAPVNLNNVHITTYRQVYDDAKPNMV